MPTNEKKKKKKVVVTLEDGLVKGVDVPDGVEVLVKDYDAHFTDENAKFDQDGAAYIESSWGGEQPRDGRSIWEHFMVALSDHWVQHYDSLAKAEGWTVFNADGTLQIQALDEPGKGRRYLTGGDGEAYDLCAKKALEGSQLHVLALYLDGREASNSMVPRVLVTKTSNFGEYFQAVCESLVKEQDWDDPYGSFGYVNKLATNWLTSIHDAFARSIAASRVAELIALSNIESTPVTLKDHNAG